MFDLSTLMVFSAATVVFLLSPGPAVIYIVARSVDQGRLAGIVSVLGINVGALVHVAATAFGLSALLVSSSVAFNGLKFAGAAYLVYLGIQKLREGDSTNDIERTKAVSLRRLFVQGVLVNVFNPKLAAFNLSFLPQFIDPARGSVEAQVLILGGISIVLGIIMEVGYALLAGSMGDWLRENVRFLRAQRYVAGTTLIGLGLATAVSGGSRGK